MAATVPMEASLIPQNGNVFLQLRTWPFGYLFVDFDQIWRHETRANFNFFYFSKF